MPPRLALAALLVLLDHLSGFGTTAETSDRVDALLRPLRDGDGLLLPELRLGERIEELERMVDDDTWGDLCVISRRVGTTVR